MRTAVLCEPFSDIESCRRDVLNFLQSLAWSVKLLEVKLWTLAGRPFGSHVWKTDEYDPEASADQIAKFINQNNVPLGAVVMAQEAEVVEFAMDLKISPCQRNALLFRPGDDVPLNQFVPQKDRSPEDPLRRPGADDFLPRR